MTILFLGNSSFIESSQLLEKEKMLVIYTSSFSLNVVKRLLHQGCWSSGLCGRGLNHY